MATPKTLKPVSPPRNRTSTIAVRASLRIASACIASALLLVSGSAYSATFFVNANVDTSDIAVGDGTCSTGNIVIISTVPLIIVPECSLRAAIEEANATPALDNIEFSGVLPTVIGFVEFFPATPLPPIERQLVIDGFSHPSYDVPNEAATPIINIRGDNTPAGTNGLHFLPGSSDSEVRGLAITDFPNSAILIGTTTSPTGPTNLTVSGNHIGIARGLAYRGNGSHGIRVESSGPHTIGKRCNFFTGCVGKRNTISANGGSGVFIDNSFGVGVSGNYIGVERLGNSTMGPFGGATANGGNGVFISASSSQNSIGEIGGILGGASVTAGNLISGNTLRGIEIDGPDNEVVANSIGTNAAGTSPLGNIDSGIGIGPGADDTVIGAAGLRGNLISGNGLSGITVDTDLFANAASRISVVNNRIGVNTSADAIIGNGSHGIFTRGDDHEINDNVIGGNTGDGISDNSSDSIMLRNFIGTNEDGDDLGNAQSGILVSDDNQVIGGAGDGNVIGFNADGIVGNTFSANSQILGNYIGTNPNGDDLGNAGDGIFNRGAGYSVGETGGRITGRANTIAFNGGNGITDSGSNTEILGNYIGTNSSGAELGNVGAGILAETTSGPNASIGAALAVLDADVGFAGNVVAYNGQGIVVDNTIELPVRGNQLIGNGGPGIDLEGDGITNNDRFDPDTGANELQNIPVINPALTFFNSGTGEIQIRFAVPSTVANAAYPLKIDFYIYDPWLNEGDQARAHLGSTSYDALNAESFVTTTITPTVGSFVPNTFGDLFGGLRATATDSKGNTSELTRVNVPVPEPGSVAMLVAGVLGLVVSARRGHAQRTVN